MVFAFTLRLFRALPVPIPTLPSNVVEELSIIVKLDDPLRRLWKVIPEPFNPIFAVLSDTFPM